MRYIVISLITILVFGCHSERSFKGKFQMEQLQKALESKTIELDVVLAKEDVELQHLVFFDLKDSISEDEKEEFIDTIRKLRKIDEVKTFNYGDFEDLKDNRALKQYEVVMDLGFESNEDYEVYQQHEKHLEVKEALGPFLGGPPAVYDYEIK